MDLTRWPRELFEVGERVRVVDAAGNRLRAVPPEIAALPRLATLNLAANALTAAAVDPSLGRLTQLRVLVLSQNGGLGALPPAVFSLAGLATLQVAGCGLTELPAAIGELRGLKALQASGNEIRAIPPEIGRCAALEELDLSHNRWIREIPDAVGGLQHLVRLNLDNNAVTHHGVPTAVLVGCARLQTLSLHANPIDAAALLGTEGYAAFEERRRGRADKAIGAGVLLGSGGFDEGFDRPR